MGEAERMAGGGPARGGATGLRLALVLLGLALYGAGPAPAIAQSAPPTPAAGDSEPEATGAPVESDTGAAAATAPAPAGGKTAPKPTAPGGQLVVASWGGAYARSQDEAVYRPFARATGIEVTRKVYAGTLEAIRAQAAGDEAMWDVVDVDPAVEAAGCDEGLFQKLSFVLPAAPDGTAATADFLPGTLQPCGVGSLAWSMVIAYSKAPGEKRADDGEPTSLQDFFDLKRYPGRRGLRRSPMVSLEWALLADGAAAEEVYDLLRTDEGVARAFAKLDTIRDHIVWWQEAGDPARLLASGEVAMTSAYNAPIFNDIVVRGQPIGLIWDRQIWDIDLWAIPAGAPNRDAAQQFVRFAASTGPLARQTRWIPYGPVRRSSLALVDGYAGADVEMSPFLPTTEQNFATALRNDAQFWQERGPALVERFNEWLLR